MGHKRINGGLMPGGRLRVQKLTAVMMAGRMDTGHLVTHRFNGLDSVETALMMMKDKPKDLIKPVIIA